MPGLTYTRTQSFFELCHIRNQFDYGVEYAAAKQEVLNRFQRCTSAGSGPADFARVAHRGDVPLHAGKPERCPGAADLRPQRPKIAAGLDFGAALPPPAADRRRDELRRDRETVRDPPRSARMQRYGITLQQLKDAVSTSNANVGRNMSAKARPSRWSGAWG